MKKNRIWIYVLLAVFGAILFYIGGFVLTQENFKMFSGLCIGIGAAAFSIGIGNFIGAILISKTKNEQLMQKKNIEMNDERNIRIREKVGAKINQIVFYFIGIIVLALGFIKVQCDSTHL